MKCYYLAGTDTRGSEGYAAPQNAMVNEGGHNPPVKRTEFRPSFLNKTS